ncbi:MAG TPA: phosphocholine cytidylyltransferase family protein [Polyangiaceae bacterium]|nr:phosphocholine cytidylyltransferase family protein [Polyangiaceae bacterium]
MRPIIIGAGRGSRLGNETTDIPKTLVQVMGRPMLEWILEALAQAGFTRKDVVFVCGYAQHVVRQRYPEFTFVENTAWETNNILASLLYARQYLQDGFLSTYADIVYDGSIVEKLVKNPHDIALGCDTAWRRRYVGRTQHPETDAEKLRAQGSNVLELSRKIPSEAAQGEFIGVMKLSKTGAGELVSAFDRAAALHAGKVWREGRTFEKAYLLDQLQDMLEQGSIMHREDTPGAYMEIDTLQDLSMAEQWWTSRP